MKNSDGNDKVAYWCAVPCCLPPRFQSISKAQLNQLDLGRGEAVSKHKIGYRTGPK